MFRIAKMPIIIPSNIKVKIKDQLIYIEGNGIKLDYNIHRSVNISNSNNVLVCSLKDDFKDWSIVGTTRALINNMIKGINVGFIKVLQLVGVGYRAILKDNMIILSLGFSHLIYYKIPSKIKVECINQNEIILKSFDKQLLGQVAASLRNYRKPEPYKGKGIRYLNEIIRIKETKKK